MPHSSTRRRPHIGSGRDTGMSAMRGKTVVVTGATAGIGRVTCERLAAMGASLVLVARDRSRVEALAATLTRAGAPFVGVHIADLSRLAEVRRVAGELASLPRIDVL